MTNFQKGIFVKQNYRKRLTEKESEFISHMAHHGDATRAAHAICEGLSDEAARVLANNLMKRPEIQKQIDFLRKCYSSIKAYVR